MGDKRSVAGRLLEAMASAGSQCAFGLPGVHNLAFWAERPSGTKAALVNVRHEQTAVYAADGFARVSGRPGFAVVTTGPGAANTVAAFGEAATSKSPVVVVASEVPRHVADTQVHGALHQSPDQAGMFRPLAKVVFTPRTAIDAVASFVAALDAATTFPQGPVYLDVPADVLSEPAPAVPELGAVPSPPPPSSLDDVCELIDASPNVAIWAGGGVVQAGAARVLASVAEHLRAPVFTTFASRGLLPPGHPCNVVLPPHEPEIEELLARADLLLVVGSDLEGMTTKNLSLHWPATVVNVNVAPDRAQVAGVVTHPVVADAADALAELLASTRARASGLADRLPGAIERTWRRLRADRRIATACTFVATIEGVARHRATVVNDMCIPGYWLAGYYVPGAPRSMQYPVGWGTLGYALPASVGAALGADRPVLAVCGDGGLMFGLGELATLAQEGLPVTVLVVDDGGYGMLRFDQRHRGDDVRGVDLATPDFVALGAAFGIPGADVSEDVGEGLAGALTDALSSHEPRLVRCTASLFPPKTTSPRWRDVS